MKWYRHARTLMSFLVGAYPVGACRIFIVYTILIFTHSLSIFFAFPCWPPGIAYGFNLQLQNRSWTLSRIYSWTPSKWELQASGRPGPNPSMSQESWWPSGQQGLPVLSDWLKRTFKIPIRQDPTDGTHDRKIELKAKELEGIRELRIITTLLRAEVKLLRARARFNDRLVGPDKQSLPESNTRQEPEDTPSLDPWNGDKSERNVANSLTLAVLLGASVVSRGCFLPLVIGLSAEKLVGFLDFHLGGSVEWGGVKRLEWLRRRLMTKLLVLRLRQRQQMLRLAPQYVILTPNGHLIDVVGGRH
ncbi:unnamed protein product [Choristocarpus tenellus]